MPQQAREFPTFLTIPAYASYPTEAPDEATKEELAAA
ncbi:malate synthase [Arthrobacter sp. Hiyo8]|nr:malate synthase [Arthrobacter sp. Hiyo8]